MLWLLLVVAAVVEAVLVAKTLELLIPAAARSTNSVVYSIKLSDVHFEEALNK